MESKRAMKLLLLMLLIIASAMIPASRTLAFGCPCPVPPFTYCRCCPPPCRIEDGKAQAISQVMLGESHQLSVLLEEAAAYLRYNHDRAGRKGALHPFSAHFLPSQTLLETVTPAVSACVKNDDLLPMSDASFQEWYKALQGDFFSHAPITNVTQALHQERHKQEATRDYNVLALATAAMGKKLLSASIDANANEALKHYSEQLAQLLSGAKEVPAAGAYHSLEDMWRLNTEVKQSLETQFLQLQQALHTLGQLKAMHRLREHHLNDAPPLLPAAFSPAFLGDKAKEASMRANCMEHCNEVTSLLKKMRRILADIVHLHNSRYFLTKYHATEAKAVEIINLHKRVFAQMREAEKQLIQVLGEFFQQPEQSFLLYVKQLQSSDGLFFDSTEYIDNMSHYQVGHEMSLRIYGHLLALASNPDELERFYGKLLPAMRKCVRKIDGTRPSAPPCRENEEYNIYYVLKKQLSIAATDILYPPYMSIMDGEIIVDDPMHQEALDRLLRSEADYAVKALYYPLTENAVLATKPVTFYTQSYKALVPATLFFLESVKEERYHWFFRYGNNVEEAKAFFGHKDPKHYENVTPIWAETGSSPWWEREPFFNENLIGKERFIPAEVSAVRFTKPSGAEGLLLYMDELIKWAREYYYTYVDAYISPQEEAMFGHESISRLKEEKRYAGLLDFRANAYYRSLLSQDKASFSPLKAYLRTETGIAHLEYVMLQSFLEVSDLLEKTLATPFEGEACGCDKSQLFQKKSAYDALALTFVDALMAGKKPAQLKKTMLQAESYMPEKVRAAEARIIMVTE